MKYRTKETLKYIKDKAGIELAQQTMAKYRCEGGGPAFTLFGRWPLYEDVDIDQWLSSRLSGRKRNNSDPGENQQEVA